MGNRYLHRKLALKEGASIGARVAPSLPHTTSTPLRRSEIRPLGALREGFLGCVGFVTVALRYPSAQPGHSKIQLISPLIEKSFSFSMPRNSVASVIY